MAENIKIQFRDFVNEEIVPELTGSSGYSREELMQKEITMERMDEPETFNGEIMNNFQLVCGDYRFDCFLDEELISRVGNRSMKFSDLLKVLE